MNDVAYVSLGSNLGDRAAYLAMARAALTLVRGVHLLAASRVEETIPLGLVAQGPYLNQMVALRTSHEPCALLIHLQRIERTLGRVRSQRWSARTIDLDIVRYRHRTFTSAYLVVPHPGLADREFWRRGAAELDVLTRDAA